MRTYLYSVTFRSQLYDYKRVTVHVMARDCDAAVALCRKYGPVGTVSVRRVP